EFTRLESSNGFFRSRCLLPSESNDLAEKIVVNVQQEGLIECYVFGDAGGAPEMHRPANLYFITRLGPTIVNGRSWRRMHRDCSPAKWFGKPKLVMLTPRRRIWSIILGLVQTTMDPKLRAVRRYVCELPHTC